MQLITTPPAAVLAVLLIDRSTSMRPFSDDVRAAFNAHIADLQASPQARSIMIAVVSFCGAGLKLEIPPTMAMDVLPMRPLAFAGGTPLYASTRTVLSELLGIGDPAVKVVLNVLTDGDDRGSRYDDLMDLQDSVVPAALARGFKLSVIGFGVDGVDIARRMGFIPGLSVNVAGTREGMTSTFQTITKSILN